MLRTLERPTPEQCSVRAKVGENETFAYYAIWYPQMGGYRGAAVAEIYKDPSQGECFDVRVWHDGEFPLHGDPHDDTVILHHCEPGQFIVFGKQVRLMQKIAGADSRPVKESGVA